MLPVGITLGTTQLTSNLYVDPIRDEMLLGFDTPKPHRIHLCLAEGEIKLGDNGIKITMGHSGEDLLAARIKNAKCRVIPLQPSVEELDMENNPSLLTQYLGPEGFMKKAFNESQRGVATFPLVRFEAKTEEM